MYSKLQPVSRRRTLSFVHAYLALQLLGPLGYYLWRDRYDERWAWRMFSSVRAHRCSTIGNLKSPPAFVLDGQPVDLDGTFHEAWVNLTRRARPEVMAAIAARLCRQHPGADLRVTYECRDVKGNVERFESGLENWCVR